MFCGCVLRFKENWFCKTPRDVGSRNMSDSFHLLRRWITHLVQLLCWEIQGVLLILGKTMCYGNYAVSFALRHCWQGACLTTLLYGGTDQAMMRCIV